MEKEEEREDGNSYRTLVVITVGEVVLEAQKMGSSTHLIITHSLTHSKSNSNGSCYKGCHPHNRQNGTS